MQIRLKSEDSEQTHYPVSQKLLENLDFCFSISQVLNGLGSLNPGALYLLCILHTYKQIIISELLSHWYWPLKTSSSLPCVLPLLSPDVFSLWCYEESEVCPLLQSAVGQPFCQQRKKSSWAPATPDWEILAAPESGSLQLSPRKATSF